jgi:hypothetical protein
VRHPIGAHQIVPHQKFAFGGQMPRLIMQIPHEIAARPAPLAQHQLALGQAACGIVRATCSSASA